MVEINKRIVGPELAAQFLPRDQCSRTFHQQDQDFERLFPELDPDAKLSELS